MAKHHVITIVLAKTIFQVCGMTKQNTTVLTSCNTHGYGLARNH